MQFSSTMFKAAAVVVFLAGVSPAVAGSAQGYRFELAGPAAPAGAGQHSVSVRLIRASDGKPVSGATFTGTRLDMGPENMASMTAPVREIPNSASGVYSFSFDDAAVWKWKGDWALSLTAKLPGAPQAVSGRIIFHAGT
ncbi:MAG: FixH family protein [Alphaproteobacteria bacterium]|nr:FixH family protein [Alphaproteobacteria bacterium]MDE2630185.1 FixH family protein [Alphaproteobacteria bacterium]